MFATALVAAILLPLPKEADISETTAHPVRVVERIVSEIPAAGPRQEEAYHLSITDDQLLLEATTWQGLVQGRKTISQLGPDLPICEITDWPSFRIRGFMQDVGRTYISIPELKREIDILSGLKLNVFHIHLTENEAWRLQSPSHPELTDPGTMTRQDGLFYTLEEIRDLDIYCHQRGMILIPEIDMPGHSAAFERATGLRMDSPKGRAILKDVLMELASVTSGPWIHLGTDEVSISDPGFVPEMMEYVRNLGKKVITWDPGYSSDVAPDMQQLWSYRGKATPGIPAIDCRFHYINHFDIFSDIVGLHTSTVYGCTEDSPDIAGSIIALWNDRYVDDESSLIRQNNLFAAAAALADRTWRGGGWQYFDDFGVVIPDCGPVRDDFLDFEQRLMAFLPDDSPYVPQGAVRWKIAGPFPNGGDLTAEFPWQDAPMRTVIGAGIAFRHCWGSTVPGLFKDPQPNSTAYAVTEIEVPYDMDAALFFETQNYSRSEKDKAPPQGQWDYRGSRLYLDDTEILPVEWTPDDGTGCLGNENAAARPPIPLHLSAGRHRIVIKLPVGEFTTREVRLVKWGFTCLLLTPDGKAPAEVHYIP